MRIALVGPELEENLALRYIHSAVVAAGGGAASHEAEIFDFNEASQIEQLAGQIALYQPDLVGLSMVFTARAREYLDLADRLRQFGYRGHITAGGHFATFHAAELLGHYRFGQPAIDSIIHGEAEEAIVELLSHLSDPTAVAGVSGRDGGGQPGHVVLAQPGARENIADLDSRPWPTRPDKFHDYLGMPIANMLSSRGCYANCRFCSINAWHRHVGGPRFRLRRPECVAAEMAALFHDRGVRIFNFHDDNFFLPDRAAMLARLNELHANLKSLGVGTDGSTRIAVQVKARPCDIHPDTLAALCEIGLFRVFLGVENAAVDGLRHLGRGVNREQNRRALELLSDAGIHVSFNLLIFEPDCVEADVRQNVQFMRQYSAFPLNFCRTEVYSGTQLERQLREQGRLLGDYFGYYYRIGDTHMQRAFEIFRDVFTPRNFTCDGMNHEAMRLDYYYHILRHFWPDRAGAGLCRKVKTLVSKLNHNNADLMDGVLDLAVSDPDSQTRASRTAELSALREEFDTTGRGQFHAVLAEMVTLAAQKPGCPPAQTPQPGHGRWLSGMAKAAAAAALVVGTLGGGCKKDQTTCDPVPLPQKPASRPESRPDTADFEMAPGPMPADGQSARPASPIQAADMGAPTLADPPQPVQPPVLAPLPAPEATEMAPHATEMAPPPPPPVHADTYVIKLGDTLMKIAREQLGDESRWQEIVKLNPGLDPNKLPIGYLVKLPAKTPVTHPASQPASQPDFGKSLLAADIIKVSDYLNGPGMSAHLLPVAQKHQLFLVQKFKVSVRVDASGWVKQAAVELPPGQPGHPDIAPARRAEFKAYFEQALVGVEIPGITTAGSAQVTVTLIPPIPPIPPPCDPVPHPAPMERAPGPHMMERAPAPQLEEQSFQEPNVVLLANPDPTGPPASQPNSPPLQIRLQPHMSEMVAFPVNPPPPNPPGGPGQPGPTSQPGDPRPAGPATSQPGDTLSPPEVKTISDYLNGPGMGHLYPVAIKRASLSKTVTVRVVVDKTGWVKGAKVTLPPDAPYLELKKELEDTIVGIEIPGVTSAGSATFAVKLTMPRPPRGPEVEMFEMAPAPR